MKRDLSKLNKDMTMEEFIKFVEDEQDQIWKEDQQWDKEHPDGEYK